MLDLELGLSARHGPRARLPETPCASARGRGSKAGVPWDSPNGEGGFLFAFQNSGFGVCRVFISSLKGRGQGPFGAKPRARATGHGLTVVPVRRGRDVLCCPTKQT